MNFVNIAFVSCAIEMNVFLILLKIYINIYIRNPDHILQDYTCTSVGKKEEHEFLLFLFINDNCIYGYTVLEDKYTNISTIL